MTAPVGPSREATAVGIEVATTWGEQDKLDPHRPTLGQVVAEVVDRRLAGRRSTDGEAAEAVVELAALRARIEATIEQRLTLAAEREAVARRHLSEPDGATPAAGELRWAGELRAQASTLRQVLG